MKKLLSLLCMAACLFSLAACTTDSGNNNAALSESEQKSYNSVFEFFVEGIASTPDADVALILENEGGQYVEEVVSGVGVVYPAWKNNRSEIGEYIGILETECKVAGDTVVVTGKVDYSKRDASVRMTFDKNGAIAGFAIEPFYTWGEKMTKAALNTVIGIGVVFSVLILMSLLISCFKYINRIETAVKNKRESKSQIAQEGMDNTIAQIVQKEEEELVDDLELAAVIAAAVAAYTGTSADGFVVRSIRKSNKNKWKNA